MTGLFSKTNVLESKIEEYLDHTSEVGMLFLEAMKDYLNGRSAEFESRRKQVNDLENHADDLRRQVERQLYVETLIPESRGDVLGLLEHTDEVINKAKVALMRLSVQRPDVPESVRQEYLEIADYGSRAVQELVAGIRAFFRNPTTVTDHVHKVGFWEKEADKVAERVQRCIFDMDIELGRKIHLANFVRNIDAVADEAEDVSERLSISAIKRSI